MKARTAVTRRGFLAGSVTAAAALTAWPLLRPQREPAGTLFAAFEDAQADQYVGGLDLRTHRVFGARVGMRAHGCAVDPLDPQRVIFFARRPGTVAYQLRHDTMQVETAFETGAGQHLAGHGLFSPNGAVVLVPEYDYERVRGVLTVRDARDFRIVREIDTHGIDPHEIAWLPDSRTVLVANGGILTHPRTFRRKLNIATMDPSLCAIDVDSSQVRQQWRLPDHLLSIRHLAVARDGSVAAGLQYEGDVDAAPGIVALRRPGSDLRLLAAPAAEIRRFKGYVASVAISDKRAVIAAACPYGNGVACWSLHDERYLGFIPTQEAYGLSRLADDSILASQRDGTVLDLDGIRLRSHFVALDSAKPIRWDDHWLAVG